MTTAKTYPSNRCGRHGIELVDVLEPDGRITHACPVCEPLELVNVVRQLFRRKEST